MADEKKGITKQAEEIEEKEISMEDLDEVAGGGAFNDIPRVPNRKPDDKLKDKI